ncbi:FUSC family protein [Microbacterium album]|uniref:Integral membrane bound transporter domain-containing protein n=1 Tax=Microbacterium album TaxID=2053191 RepID=A0A917MPK2_9MICO|nr:FUSC family protein [Microbacterium album]GGH47934.1 hypothetical protein GCM10010921_25030 [Microbacterium album]
MRRLKEGIREAAGRLRRHGASVLLAALAAAVAFALAGALFGPENAFFAPIAAVLSVGLGGGRRMLRTIEISGGVLVGVLVGELVSLLPLPTPVALAIAVALGMGTAVSVRASPLLSNQAAVAAVVTMVLTPVTQAAPFLRLGDAVLGGMVALAIAVPATLRPERALRVGVRAVTDREAAVVDRLAAALRGERVDVDAAVRDVTAATTAAESLDDAIRAARESVRLGRRARELRRGTARAARMRAEWQDLAASIAALARATRALLREHREGRSAAAHVAQLAEAVRAVTGWAVGPEPIPETDALRHELRELARSLTVDLGGQLAARERVLLSVARTAVVDLLRMTGMSHRDAVEAATSVPPA